jgi:polyisoprenyl-phosphate glycosyltransferase
MVKPSLAFVSVVIPLWNEAEGLPQLFLRLGALQELTPNGWEFIFVNDGSTDATQLLLEQNLSRFRRAKIIKLARNFGQQPAYRAGLQAASGAAVVFLDGDLQDPPELIPDMVEIWRNGAQVVVGCRKSRAETGLRRILFDGFHEIFHRVTGGVMPKNSGTFGLMDRLVADQLKQMPEVNVFLPALRSWFGYDRRIVFYDRAERAEGEAKQSFLRLFRYAWDGITSFSDVPLHAISLAGIVISALSFGYGLILLSLKLVQIFGFWTSLQVPGFTTLAVAIFFMGGLQLISLGVLGQYLARIYAEVKRRPPYIVESILETGSSV